MVNSVSVGWNIVGWNICVIQEGLLIKMKIGYSRLFNLGNFENEKIELKTTCEEGEEKSKLIELKKKVMELKKAIENE